MGGYGHENSRWHEMSDEHDLTPEERMAFHRLPREAEPSRLLEERIVRSLQEEGILDSRGGVVDPAREGAGVHRAETMQGGAWRARGIWIRPWMAVAAVAATLTLFGSGVFLGQWIGSQSTAQAFLAVREQDAAQLAMTIQEAGTAYVSALAALGELRAGEGEGGTVGEGAVYSAADLQQGREVALGALYGAAFELARMGPEDADVVRVLQILEDRRAREEGFSDSPRNWVWF